MIGFVATAKRFRIVFCAALVGVACVQQAGALSNETFQLRQSTLRALENDIEAGRLLRATDRAPREKEEARCQAAYRRLFDRGELAISIVYGYNDQRPYTNVLDGDEKSILRAALLAPCRSNLERLCGFVEGRDGVLRKAIEDVDGRRVAVALRLTSSSVSGDDNANRTSLVEQQKAVTAAARKEFVRAVREDQVVFYIGHARNGGGPDFAPPVLNGAGKVDLSRYQARQEGLKLLVSTLPQAERLKLLGLFACASSRHFAAPLLQAKKDVAYLLAGDVTMPTPMNHALWGALHSLLGRSCEKAMAASVTTVKAGVDAASFTLNGFF
jgi:hypothetical protein